MSALISESALYRNPRLTVDIRLLLGVSDIGLCQMAAVRVLRRSCSQTQDPEKPGSRRRRAIDIGVVAWHYWTQAPLLYDESKLHGVTHYQITCTTKFRQTTQQTTLSSLSSLCDLRHDGAEAAPLRQCALVNAFLFIRCSRCRCVVSLSARALY